MRKFAFLFAKLARERRQNSTQEQMMTYVFMVMPYDQIQRILMDLFAEAKVGLSQGTIGKRLWDQEGNCSARFWEINRRILNWNKKEVPGIEHRKAIGSAVHYF